MKQTIEIISSHGQLTAHKESGRILDIVHDTADGQELRGYVYFDIEEWKTQYPGEELPDSIDILDCRLLTQEGVFEDACQDWRDRCERESLADLVYDAMNILRRVEAAWSTTNQTHTIRDWLNNARTNRHVKLRA